MIAAVWEIVTRILAAAIDFSVLQIVQMGFGAHLATYSVGSEVLWPGKEAEVKKEWNYTSIHGLDRDKSV